MVWERGDDLVVVFRQREESEKDISQVVDELQEVADKHGFRWVTYGDHDSMLRSMQEVGFKKYNKLIDEIMGLDPKIIGKDREFLELLNYETLLELVDKLKLHQQT